jgi:hypothetical protein
MYSAYQLDTKQRDFLLKQFPPRYLRVIADHITVCFGGNNVPLPEPAKKVEMIGMADDNNGLQALIVRVDNQLVRADGQIYHITWSLDPNKKGLPDIDSTPNKTYKHVHSNRLILGLMNRDGTQKQDCNPDWKLDFFAEPILLHTKPVLKLTSSELKKQALKEL